jgi:hypothetical protein
MTFTTLTWRQALVLWPAVAGMVFLTGCESMSARVHDRFDPVEPKVQVYDGDLKTVYYASQEAFKQLGFVLTKASISSWRVEAASPINSNAALGDSRQLVAELHLSADDSEHTAVEMILTQQVHDDSLGASSQQKLREHGFYDTYFVALLEVLARQKLAAPKS